MDYFFNCFIFKVSLKNIQYINFLFIFLIYLIVRNFIISSLKLFKRVSLFLLIILQVVILLFLEHVKLLSIQDGKYIDFLKQVLFYFEQLSLKLGLQQLISDRRMNFVQGQDKQKLALIEQIFQKITKCNDIHSKNKLNDEKAILQLFKGDHQKKNDGKNIIADKIINNQITVQHKNQSQIIPQSTDGEDDLSLIRNKRSLSNIHLRHILITFLKSQCKKIEQEKPKKRFQQIKDLPKSLVYTFFMRYTLIFQQMQTITYSETINKQIKKAIVTIYTHIVCTIYKRGYRRYITFLKMILKIWYICDYLSSQTLSTIKRQIRQKTGIQISFLMTSCDKLCYQLAFKLKQVPVNFNYEEQKKIRRNKFLEKRKEKERNKILRQKIKSSESRNICQKVVIKAQKQQQQRISNQKQKQIQKQKLLFSKSLKLYPNQSKIQVDSSKFKIKDFQVKQLIETSTSGQLVKSICEFSNKKSQKLKIKSEQSYEIIYQDQEEKIDNYPVVKESPPQNIRNQFSMKIQNDTTSQKIRNKLLGLNRNSQVEKMPKI